ncbi:DeoR family fructose operon transcriptional repressor [Enterococcus sp. PF1-24]|uniref:DeoR/GlpR family DNA-binding transcription regulator n=1 Tax=unclassified Enterococcus TaxID=2608891 RepID=UPI002476EF27|nr:MULTISPECIES: DeoR/GlpR family DNA-binding transcription regulator [unclassified Enterococcus]MDH6363187.1 DeoR family fructose operon transcriptional repressor [Enterococcus sp. PFB1-1]MDH6400281.1 DeoR family fructose operon transcriptional repressor [Enterococcus sp. PF1-24]
MLTEERRERILQLLTTQTIVKTQDLMQQLDASESTIRRDLQELENEGLLERVHGGAKINQKLAFELNMQDKSSKNSQEKKKIAQLAVAEIHEGDVIYLDAGSTTLEMIPLLQGKQITVVTNSVGHAAQLVNLNIPTMILGGNIKLTTDAVLGTTAIQQLKQLRFNKAFLGMNGADSQFGFSTPDPEEAAVKREAMEASKKSYVLIDATKFNTITFTKVLDLESATILTDYCPPEYLATFAATTTIKEANSVEGGK